MPEDHPDLERWLGEVGACLPRRVPRADVLAELRSGILDRVEEAGHGEATPEAIRAAIAATGEPAEVALAYSGDRALIDPRLHPSFVTYTAIVFAIHLVMIVAAAAFDAAIEVFPFAIADLPGRGGLLGLLLAAVQALIFDIGLMVVLFALLTRARPTLRLPRLAFPVRAGLRHCAARASLAAVAFLAFNPFRDRVFVVWTDDGPRGLLTAAFTAVLPLLNALLGLLVLRELLYALFGERRITLAFDALVSLAGAALMLHLVTQPSLLAFPAPVASVSDSLPTVNHLVGSAFRIIIVLFAAAFAAEAVKRAWRLLRSVPRSSRA